MEPFAAVKLGYIHVFHSQGLGAPIGLNLGFVDVTTSKSTSCGSLLAPKDLKKCGNKHAADNLSTDA